MFNTVAIIDTMNYHFTDFKVLNQMYENPTVSGFKKAENVTYPNIQNSSSSKSNKTSLRFLNKVEYL